MEGDLSLAVGGEELALTAARGDKAYPRNGVLGEHGVGVFRLSDGYGDLTVAELDFRCVFFLRRLDGVRGKLVHILGAAADAPARVVYHSYKIAAGTAYVMSHIFLLFRFY